ncbi:hypothetical protein HC733_06510 [Pseudoalteromonas sp. S16_S37]|nr:hypothetical protein [Pseudoalteromonas sp. S16_S37]
MSDSSISDTDKQTLKNSIAQYQNYTKQKYFHPLFNNNDFGLMTDGFNQGKPLAEVKTTSLSKSYFASVGLYKEHIWPRHCQQNQQWRVNLQSKLTHYGEGVYQRLSDLLLGELVSAPTHFVYAHARPFTREGAFTSARSFVTHINSFQPNYRDWYALELLFHELSHVPFFNNERLKNSIEQAFVDQGIAEHGRIWHPILFYTVGEVTRQAIVKENPDYRPYANEKHLYQGRWDYLAELERYWLPYINGQVSFGEALDNLAKAIKQRA